ncbi:MAG: hypothetical protein GC152_12055 [Alphaproteobacteria bacterium]|nr:hypothetical protein [Alphaproteobacteria bacterium]
MGPKTASRLSRFRRRLAAALVVLSCVVAGCGFLQTDPDLVAAQRLKQDLAVAAYGPSNVETNGNRLHVVSSGGGEAGVLIEPTRATPVIVRFSYRGVQPLNLRLKRGEKFDYFSASSEEFFILGSGEAAEALFYSAGPVDFEVEVEEVSACGKNNYFCLADGKVARTLGGRGLKNRILMSTYNDARFEDIERRGVRVVRTAANGEFGVALKLPPDQADGNFVLEFEVDEPEQVQLRVDRPGVSQYHSSTRAWARLNGLTEVLLFSGTNGTFRVKGLKLIDCQTGDWRCKTEDDFVQLLPGKAADNSVSRLIALTEWVTRNADYAASQSVANEMQITGLTASQIYYRYYEPDIGGGYCGATAVFLARTLRSQGFEAFTVDFGVQSDQLTHVTTIVPFGDEFYMMDATFGGYFAEPGSERPIDIFEVIDGAAYTFRTLSMDGREFIVDQGDKRRLKRMQKLELIMNCKSVKDRDLVACERPGFGLSAYLSNFDEALKRNNLESNPQTLIEMLRRGVFGIGDSEDTDAMQRFARALDARSIALIETEGQSSPRRLLAK